MLNKHEDYVDEAKAPRIMVCSHMHPITIQLVLICVGCCCWSLQCLLGITCLSVVFPAPAVCRQGCSILGIQTQWQHGSQPLNPIEFYLESECQGIASFWVGEYEIQYMDFHIR